MNSDLDINRAVRRILVKHWVDLGRLSIRSSKGRVLIRGLLRRIPGADQPLTTPIVEAMFYEASRIRGVSQITAYLENWTRDQGRWRPTDDAGNGNLVAPRPSGPGLPQASERGNGP